MPTTRGPYRLRTHRLESGDWELIYGRGKDTITAYLRMGIGPFIIDAPYLDCDSKTGKKRELLLIVAAECAAKWAARVDGRRPASVTILIPGPHDPATDPSNGCEPPIPFWPEPTKSTAPVATSSPPTLLGCVMEIVRNAQRNHMLYNPYEPNKGQWRPPYASLARWLEQEDGERIVYRANSDGLDDMIELRAMLAPKK
jgi:hypothetical protein